MLRVLWRQLLRPLATVLSVSDGSTVFAWRVFAKYQRLYLGYLSVFPFSCSALIVALEKNACRSRIERLSIFSIKAVAHTYKVIEWLRGFLYSARHSVSVNPNNIDRLCRHMCPCCRQTCTCVINSYVSTTSVCIADLATKVVHFVVLIGIWRIDLCYAALWLWAISRCLVLAAVAAHGPSLGDTPAAIK